jgi:hypothetical protein
MEGEMKIDKIFFDEIFSVQPNKLEGTTYCHKPTTKQILCKNGVKLSVQVGEGLYCSPRNNEGPYYDVEVGFPSIDPPETWGKYFDGDWENGDKTESVYGYIPIGLVIDFINENGGINLIKYFIREAK